MERHHPFRKKDSGKDGDSWKALTKHETEHLIVYKDLLTAPSAAIPPGRSLHPLPTFAVPVITMERLLEFNDYTPRDIPRLNNVTSALLQRLCATLARFIHTGQLPTKEHPSVPCEIVLSEFLFPDPWGRGGDDAGSFWANLFQREVVYNATIHFPAPQSGTLALDVVRNASLRNLFEGEIKVNGTVRTDITRPLANLNISTVLRFIKTSVELSGLGIGTAIFAALERATVQNPSFVSDGFLVENVFLPSLHLMAKRHGYVEISRPPRTDFHLAYGDRFHQQDILLQWGEDYARARQCTPSHLVWLTPTARLKARRSKEKWPSDVIAVVSDLRAWFGRGGGEEEEGDQVRAFDGFFELGWNRGRKTLRLLGMRDHMWIRELLWLLLNYADFLACAFEVPLSVWEQSMSPLYPDSYDLVWAEPPAVTPYTDDTTFVALTNSRQIRFRDKLGEPLNVDAVRQALYGINAEADALIYIGFDPPLRSFHEELARLGARSIVGLEAVEDDHAHFNAHDLEKLLRVRSVAMLEEEEQEPRPVDVVSEEEEEEEEQQQPEIKLIDLVLEEEEEEEEDIATSSPLAAFLTEHNLVRPKVIHAFGNDGGALCKILGALPVDNQSLSGAGTRLWFLVGTTAGDETLIILEPHPLDNGAIAILTLLTKPGTLLLSPIGLKEGEWTKLPNLSYNGHSFYQRVDVTIDPLLALAQGMENFDANTPDPLYFDHQEEYQAQPMSLSVNEPERYRVTPDDEGPDTFN
jgi:hypothetical protein